MTIYLDVSAAVHRRAGIGRYTQGLTVALLAADSENEYLAFYNRPSEAQITPPLERMPRLTMPFSDKLWRLYVLLAQLARVPQDHLFPGTDLFFATDHLLPRFRRIRSVFILYDLTFRLYPQTHSLWNRWFLTLMLPRFLCQADAVIAISESTRQDAARLYGVDAARIRVVYPGIDVYFQPVPAEDTLVVRCKYHLPERFILSVGTIEPRKNYTTLLEAYRLIKGRQGELGLVIAGKKGWLYNEFFQKLRDLGLAGEVSLLGFVADDDLPALYSAADLFVFPSLYEGFGLPVLEAMACGTPVVCSNTSSLPEVAGDAALLVPPADVRALAEAMERVLTDEHLWARMGSRGLERAGGFRWERAAARTIEVYRSTLRGGAEK